MGKFHEKIVSSTTETIFQYMVVNLTLGVYSLSRGAGASKCSLLTGYLDNLLLQFK